MYAVWTNSVMQVYGVFAEAMTCSLSCVFKLTSLYYVCVIRSASLSLVL